MAKAVGTETPSMRQFRLAKEAHPDALVFFRMGDFYELFYDDAVVASKAIDITLTCRNRGAPEEIPMAGVPYHAASGYLQRLLDQGFKVAICEQMADPSKTKGLVPREVVRVVSPGVAFDDAGLPARANQFLVAIDLAASGEAGIAAADLSTGEFLVTSVASSGAALAELLRLDPSELLVGAAARAVGAAFAAERPKIAVRYAAADEAASVLAAAEAQLHQVFGASALDLRAEPAVFAATWRCMQAALVSDPRNPPPFVHLQRFTAQQFLQLDEATQRHLELIRGIDGDPKSSLLAQLDETKTGGGARLLRRRLLTPLLALPELEARLDAVDLFVRHPGLRRDTRAALADCFDLERLAVKLLTGRAGPKDLLLLRRSLVTAKQLAALFAQPLPPADQATLAALLRPELATRVPEHETVGLDACGETLTLLEAAVADDVPLRAVDGGVLREGYHTELDRLRHLRGNGQRELLALEVRLRESSGIATLKVRNTRVFGWYLEVTRSHAAKAPTTWRRKQTVATGERYSCDELDALADELAQAEERAGSLELEQFAVLLTTLAASVPRLRQLATSLAVVDVASALAEVAHVRDYVRPQLDDSLVLDITDGRHPVVERLARKTRFVPNDCKMHVPAGQLAGARASAETRMLMITGPNMAGKSTYMRQNALIILLAQMGSFVPAKRAHIGLCDRIATRVGASDNLAKGESTFMVEMKETAQVLTRATERSVVVVDEIGRGTSTYDGLAIAWAVTEHLYDEVRCRTFFATHYHELTELAVDRPGIRNVSVSAKEHAGDLVFFHALAEGAASRSYGVACAKLAGVPATVVARANVVLAALEAGRQAAPGTSVITDAPAASPSAEHAPSAEQGAERVVRPPPARDPAPLRSTKKSPQLGLFAQEPHPIILQLRALDIHQMTPLAALTLLAELSAQAGRS
jgi:DNA mismatch repair protein MutS